MRKAVLPHWHGYENEAAPVADMVLLDWYMPLITGKDVLASILKISNYRNIILFSGSDPNLYRKEDEALGAAYFLRKAAAFGELQQTLEKLFSLDWKHPL